ncbi:fibronectin type III domain-containing protein [Nonomuraea soli]|uniref:Fibronectin type-III domain-containing protein n=1 Tax=Nonomuraea soli TaxID=1032476 RepID=A0A7W0CUY1_9ACTN|nr:fibronectin type III domain-containing protein [Nonomuraea soli]MBA2897801.1 hypothetical protein [Nonomuraea soli]
MEAQAPSAHARAIARAAAAAQAGIQKQAVEVPLETTSTARVFANPDGKTFTAELSSTPVRVQREGKWQAVDPRLIERNGRLTPRAVAADVTLSSGGIDPFVVMRGDNGKSLALRWPTALHRPRIAGNTATYADAAGAGADLVVTVLSTGFRYDVVLHTRPKGPVEFRVDAETHGLHLSKSKSGAFRVEDDNGALFASVAPPVAYDANHKPGGAGDKQSHLSDIVPLPTKLTRRTENTTRITLQPSRTFLEDPKTVYPVIIDPTFTIPAASDITVRSNGTKPSDPEVVAASLYFGAGDPFRANVYLTFGTGVLAGVTVSDAQLNMWNSRSTGCGVTGRSVTVSRVIAGWDPSTITWATQPQVSAQDAATLADGPGLCSDSVPKALTWPIAPIVQAWADGSDNHGLQVTVTVPATASYSRVFHASEMTGTDAKPPTLVVTFSGGTTPKPSVLGTRVDPSGVKDGVAISRSLTPSLLTRVSDPAGRPVAAEVQLEHDPSVPSQGSGLIWTATSAPVPSAGEIALAVPQGTLSDGWLTRWRVRALAGQEQSEWSDWQLLKIDTDPEPWLSETQVQPVTNGDPLPVTATLTPTFSGRVFDIGERLVTAEFEIEHDPSVPEQGQGTIWSGKSTAVASGTVTNVPVVASTLRDGWLVRWRARAAAGSAASDWSQWRQLKIDLVDPSAGFRAVAPSEAVGDAIVVFSPTPQFSVKVTGPQEGQLTAEFEVEHDPSEPGQGTGQIWSASVANLASGATAAAAVPADVLQNGWKIRWRVRAGSTVTAPAVSDWAAWQVLQIRQPEPSVGDLQPVPSKKFADHWETPSLSPALLADASDLSGGLLRVEFEINHDETAPSQGSGRIWSGFANDVLAGTTGAVFVPEGLISDGWRVQWRARAVKAGTASSWSSWEHLAVNRAATLPVQPPTGVTAGAGNRAASVSWSPPAAGDITSYLVASQPDGHVTRVARDVHEAAVGGLLNGRSSTFTVAALTADGASVFSPASNAVVPAEPIRPGIPAITDVYPRDSAMRVAWAAPAGGAQGLTGYELVIEPGGTVVEISSDESERILTGLTNGIPYSFAIRAVNANGVGELSPPSEPIAPTPAIVPLRPLGTLATPLNQRVDLQWVPPADGGSPITGYEVEVNPGNRRVDVPADTTVIAINDLENGTAYTFDIWAKNKAGMSAAARLGPVTPVAARAPEAPADLRVSPLRDGVVSLSWAPPSDPGTSQVIDYEVAISPGGRTITATDCEGQPVTCTLAIDGLDPATGYSFTVQAANATGSGTISRPVGPIEPKLVVKQAPKLLTPQSLATLQEARADGMFVFKTPTQQVLGLVQGDLISFGSIDKVRTGYLGRVTKVEKMGDYLGISTERASLGDAVSEGKVAMDLSLTSGEDTSLLEARPGIELRQPLLKGKTQGELAARQARGLPEIGIRDGNLVIEISQEFGGGSVGPIGKIEAQAEVGLDPKLESDPKTGEVKASLAFTNKEELRVKGGASVEWKKTIRLGKVTAACVTLPVGTLPVTICPEFRAGLEVESSGSAGISFAVGHEFEASIECVVGGPNAYGCQAPEPSKTENMLEAPNAYGDGSVLIAVPVHLSFLIYGVVGPALSGRPYAELKVDTTQDPWWEIRIGLLAGVAINTGPLVPGDGTLWEKVDLVKVFYTPFHSGGPFFGMKITPQKASTHVGGVIALKAVAVRYPDAALNTQWSVTDAFNAAGKIDQTGQFTAERPGIATVQAIAPADGTHPELKAQAIVSVDKVPGSPEAVAVKPTTRGLFVTWQPPKKSGAGKITKYLVVATPELRSPLQLPGSGRRAVYSDAQELQAFIGELNPGEPYIITVQAINAFGPSEPSAEVYGTPTYVNFGFLTGRDLATDANGIPDTEMTTGGSSVAASADGRYIFFNTTARSNLAPKEIYDPSSDLVYAMRKDLLTGEIVVASRGRDGNTPVPAGHIHTASGDGTSVAYNITEGSMNFRTQIHNIATRTSRTIESQVSVHALTTDGSRSLISRAVTSAEGFDIQTALESGGNLQDVDLCESAGEDCTDPDMTDDGSKIVYAKSGDETATENGIYLYDAESSSSTKLFRDTEQILYNPFIADGGGSVAVMSHGLDDEPTFHGKVLAVAPPDATSILRSQVAVEMPHETSNPDRYLILLNYNGAAMAYYQETLEGTAGATHVWRGHGGPGYTLPNEASDSITAPVLTRGGSSIYGLVKQRNFQHIPGVFSVGCGAQNGNGFICQ